MEMSLNARDWGLGCRERRESSPPTLSVSPLQHDTLPLFVSLATHRLQLRSINMVSVSTPALCVLPFANISPS
jgi:hypothetical protein